MWYNTRSLLGQNQAKYNFIDRIALCNFNLTYPVNVNEPYSTNEPKIDRVCSKLMYHLVVKKIAIYPKADVIPVAVPRILSFNMCYSKLNRNTNIKGFYLKGYTSPFIIQGIQPDKLALTPKHTNKGNAYGLSLANTPSDCDCNSNDDVSTFR